MPSAPRFSPRRALGSTGFIATALGAGDLADRNVPVETCVATLRRALDAGLNVVDTAPSYENGYSEEIVGQALQGRRGGVFLIDKIDHFDRPVAAQVEESLARLGTPVDLFVFHGVSSLDVWNELRKPGGRWEELEAVVRAGKARFRGISCHHPDVLAAAIPSGLCDVVMFPVGPFVDARYVDVALPLARRHGVGTVCFKAFGAGKLLGDSSGYGRPLETRPRGKLSSGGTERQDEPLLPRLSVAECLNYTLTCDPDVTLLGLSFPNEQDAAFSAAENFRPQSRDELAGLRERAVVAMRDKGAAWWNPPV
ncbi:MAG TPA: aldo/keto reductase [Polyangiaceae bacterium]|jgi:aryl-alcohol dehydrogenase-like predicted oxidoreductase|nr:aldo/keto reductase [Polyangiaceae bacterium]